MDKLPQHVTVDVLDHPSIRHGFFGRIGGVGTGLFQSLNCGPGSTDNPAAVAENRQRVAWSVGVTPENMLSLWQVHSSTVVTVQQPFTEKPQADGMVTNVPGLALGVLSADCGPLLFADPVAKVIGAAHAGWKGALHGVLENTLLAMEALGARRERISGALGPCIGPQSYEVDAGFRDKFLAVRESYSVFFTPNLKPGHFLFDLPAFLQHRAGAAGLNNFVITGIDTYTAEKQFFSYRRTTHRQEADYGRQISVISLLP